MNMEEVGHHPLDKVDVAAYHYKQYELFKEFIAFLGVRYLGGLAVYFDDSGSDDGSPVAIMGGIVASAEKWDKFIPEWQERLRADGISVFHMTDLTNRTGEFEKGWTPEREILFMKDLTEIIRKNVQFLIGAVVPRLNFDIAKLSFPGVIEPPIQICADYSIVQLAKWAAKSGDRNNMALVFDGGQKVMRKLINLFCEKFNPDWNKVYGSRRTHIPLQAADLFAYQLFRFYRAAAEGKEMPSNKALEAVLNGVEINITFGSVETIQHYFANLPILDVFS